MEDPIGRVSRRGRCGGLRRLWVHTDDGDTSSGVPATDLEGVRDTFLFGPLSLVFSVAGPKMPFSR